MSARHFILTEEAQIDLDAIGSYTLERWGPQQVIRYLTQIDESFHSLGRTKANDRDESRIQPRLLSVKSGSHVIFFRRRENGDAEVLRILHQRMDFRRHL